jgi:oligopeptide/dipeptide ABC transporter ATP-binding protein
MCDSVAVMYAGRVIEAGPVRTIFNAPVHPYTQALIESIPRLGGGPSRLTAIDGQPPDLATLPRGCSFQARCPRVVDRCREEEPPVSTIGADHTARCWLAK